MKAPQVTLAQLRINRDHALQRATAGVNNALQTVGSSDSPVISFARNHPIMAIGGAAAAGVTAGLLIGGHSVRNLTKAAGVVVLKPLALKFVQQFVQQFGDAEENPE